MTSKFVMNLKLMDFKLIHICIVAMSDIISM